MESEIEKTASTWHSIFSEDFGNEDFGRENWTSEAGRTKSYDDTHTYSSHSYHLLPDY